MRTSIEDREKLWDEYLKLWPIERLRTMTLPEYTTAGDVNCLVYWIEAATEKLGSIWGGSAFKSGIYSRKDQSSQQDGAGRKYSPEYAWYVKYGDEPNVVFENVRNLIISIVEAAVRGDLSAIDDIDLGDSYKWKLAFLYQDRNNPKIVPIYTAQMLSKALSSKSKVFSEMNQTAIQKFRGENIFHIQDELLEAYQKTQPSILTPQNVIEFLELSEVYKPTMAFTDDVAGFQGPNGHQIAVILRNNKATILLSAGEWLESIKSRFEKVTYFSEKDTRNSKWVRCTPSLAVGNSIFRLEVPNIEALQALCEAYEDMEINPNKVLKDKSVMSDQNNKSPLNQILFGPPGTGKTFATVDEALKIIDPEFYESNQDYRVKLKGRFDEAVNKGEVHFVTFHQSYSYEDFIEGIAAITDDSGQLRYEPKEGVFKQICDLARSKITAYKSTSNDLSGRKIWKMSLGNTLGEDSYIYDDCIKNNVALIGYGGNIDFTGCKSNIDIHERFQKAGSDVALDSFAIWAVSTFILKVKQGDLIVVTDGNFKFRAIGEFAGDYENINRTESGDHYTIGRKVNWLREYSPSLPSNHLMENDTVFSQRTIYQLRESVISLEKLESLLGSEPVDSQNGQKPYVLIIDEINRGNISRIFGELITLIEPSKRDGNLEALTVTLPYSKHNFSIPDNVYLIGTMNTADRSLTGLDIALRRRFTFKEMIPKPELLDDVVIKDLNIDLNIGQMLRVMNERIEVLLDRDHCLGHAYFMPLKEDQRLERLAFIFRQQILPLLQEYFFEDWERISWVLNDQVKPHTKRFVQTAAIGVSELFGQETAGKLQDRRWRLNTVAFNDIESYKSIVGKGI